MPLTIVATPGAPNANSYATELEGDAYHEARVHSSDWTGASVETKRAALVHATRLLDRHFTWIYWPTTAEQALQWPRHGVRSANPYNYVGSMVIPQELKNATCELARQLIVEDRTLDSDVETQGLTSLRAGPVSLTFKDGVEAKVVPDAVLNLIPEWWYEKGGRGAFRDNVRV